ncbi:MAG TPA: DsrE family protein [Ferruginibacter sp.]|nr:DsrE family protein [Chitinophagaceae bacterium]MBK9530364.1 DsrE family protein [Chitinophagaceae bacterium]HQW94056.1 DsrE family protein [Ferruginibacter sp.]
MKPLCLLAMLLLSATGQLFAQPAPYHVVFDITTSDTATHQRVIRWSKSIMKTYPDAKIEIVFYGKALDMVVQNRSTVAEDVKKLAVSKQVVFAVCEQAMKFHKIEKSQLISDVQTVPDALYELVTRQKEGYGYIKVVN